MNKMKTAATALAAVRLLSRRFLKQALQIQAALRGQMG